jgi:endoglucanase Acf2
LVITARLLRQISSAMKARLALSLLIGAVAACGAARLDLRSPPPPPQGKAEKHGAGYVSNVPPKGVEIATDRRNESVEPKVTDDFEDLPKSNTWWSSLIWQFDETNPYSMNLYAHPLVMRAGKQGLGMGYPNKPAIKPREYMYRYAEDVSLGLEGQTFSDTRVAGYSDFAVTASWKNEAAELRLTIGHGLPYVYGTRSGSARALVAILRGTMMDLLKDDGHALLLRLNDHFYGLFAPSQSKWEKVEQGYANDLAGKDYFSVALLPDGEPATYDLFKSHAYAFVTDTKVSWRYDDAKATLTTTFKATVTAKETGKGREDSAILALYRHQWLDTEDSLEKASYVSPRGQMKLHVGSEFTTKHEFPGVLPVLPNAAKLSAGDVKLTEAVSPADLFPKGYGPGPTRDAYWAGKSLGRNATNLYLADQLGDEAAKQRMLTALKNELSDWFDGSEPRHLYYDETWHSVIALPASYGSAAQLNDHHFHYGYFVAAAAAIARYDQAWATSYAPMVELLVRDAANWDHDDDRFPFLRHMDAYAGHSWANGPAQFDDGNNEESSSEDILLSASLVLWGSVTDHKQLRDLGIFLFTTQVLAAEQYWFDVDDAVFPEGFDHSTVAMVWGAGAKYDTWFDADPIMVHGINYLPFTGASTYLGRHPSYVSKNFGEVLERSQGSIYSWRDYLLMYLALAEPERAQKMYEEDTYFDVEFGNTHLLLQHWLENIEALGRVDTTITANIPTYAVFKGPKGKSYVAYNASGHRKEVEFSDGTKLEVEPRTQSFKLSN